MIPSCLVGPGWIFLEEYDGCDDDSNDERTIFYFLNLVMKIINDKFSPQLYLHLCELVLPFTFLQNKPSGQRYYDG